ncbi:Importin subunit beta-3, partial [Neolecta irregularis DAH-3]
FRVVSRLTPTFLHLPQTAASSFRSNLLCLASQMASNDLGLVVSQLSSPDNHIRTVAENSLNQLVNDRPDMTIPALAEQTRRNPDPQIRSLCIVLLRRMTFKPPPNNLNGKLIWVVIGPVARAQIQNMLLQGLETEQDSAVRRKLCDTVAEFARHIMDDQGSWPELLQSLLECTKSADPSFRDSGYRVFMFVPGLIESQHSLHLEAVFKAGLEDSNPDVRLIALKSFASFLVSMDTQSAKRFTTLLPSMMNVLPPLARPECVEDLIQALIAVVELAGEHGRIFAALFPSLIQFCISVVKNKELEDMARQSALELLVTFSESSPAMCRKTDQFAQLVIFESLSLMTEISQDDDDATEWRQSDDLDFDESDSNHVAGEQTLDRISRKLGPKTVVPAAFSYLPGLIGSQNWRERHAALMAISAIAEGCDKAMRKELSRVLDMVLPMLRDPHPRVKWAACNAVGQMSTDFADYLQQNFHLRVMEALVPILESQEPRVQAHAAAALVNFCEAADDDLIEPYLDGILERLVGLLKSDKSYVREQATTTIATVAGAAETKFEKYYDLIMPLLLQILWQADGDDHKMLRAKAMECATLIATAVGKEKFAPDAQQLIQVLGTIQQNISKEDDPQTSYIIPAWGRVCRAIGSDFVPYLSHVMPSLIKSAKIEPNITIVEDEAEVAKFDEGWDWLPTQGQYLGIKTSSLEEKCSAVEMLVVYASVLKGDFAPYVQEVLSDIIIPGLKFKFNEGVREASAKALAPMIDSVKRASNGDTNIVSQVSRTCLDRILELMEQDPNVAMIAEAYQAFYETLDVVGTQCIAEADINRFIAATETQLRDYVKRKEARDKHIAEDGEEAEHDEDVIEEIETDEMLFGEISKALHCMFKLYKAAYLPHFNRLLPIVDAFMSSNDRNAKNWSLCLIDDLLEFMGPEAINYSQHFASQLMVALEDKGIISIVMRYSTDGVDPVIRQVTAYGIGVAAQFGGEVFSEFCAHALPLLFQMTEIPEARDDDNVYATENACAAIARVCRFNSSKIPNLSKVIKSWFSTLPIVNDEEEAPFAYIFLAELIEQNNPVISGHQGQLFHCITQALEANTVQGKNAERAVGALKQLMTMLPPAEAQALFQHIPPERQQLLANKFQLFC